MKRRALWALWLGMLALVSSSRLAEAQSRTSLDHYRFLPRLSTLNQSGGFGGFDVDFRVMGQFDLAIEPGPTDGWPIVHTAKFVNVEAWASHPILAYVLHLDETLNLSGLKGEQLPVAAPFDVFKFTGETNEGSAVNLWAAVIGPWLHLSGSTTPPPGSADFFEYELRALARRRPFADFNGNDGVDAGDLAKWKSRFGLDVAAGDELSQGDADGDNDVDGADFLQWQQQLGDVAPPMENFDAMVAAALATTAVSDSAAIAAVPEPGGFALLAVGGALFMAWRRR